MKILTVVGARPQFIKAAVISRAFSMHPSVTEKLIHTGQHYDTNMSDLFFSQLDLPIPHINLGINHVDPAAMVGKIAEGVEAQILLEKPGALIVYGDTNSTLGGALAAVKQNVKLIHVEAGLRSFNMKMPEEINRIVTDRISNLLFCPTQKAMDNLREEGYDGFTSDYFFSGDVMLDATLHYKNAALSEISDLSDLLDQEFVLCTIHRAENTDDVKKLTDLVFALNSIASKIKVICPLHPRTAKRINELGLKADFTIIDPVGYFEMIRLLNACKLVLTDSGGLQKEAYFHKKLSICLREETEWTELEEDGYLMIAGTHPKNILNAFDSILNTKLNFDQEYYGNGHAGEFIVKEILNSL